MCRAFASFLPMQLCQRAARRSVRHVRLRSCSQGCHCSSGGHPASRPAEARAGGLALLLPLVPQSGCLLYSAVHWRAQGSVNRKRARSSTQRLWSCASEAGLASRDGLSKRQAGQRMYACLYAPNRTWHCPLDMSCRTACCWRRWARWEKRCCPRTLWATRLRPWCSTPSKTPQDAGAWGPPHSRR